MMKTKDLIAALQHLDPKGNRPVYVEDLDGGLQPTYSVGLDRDGDVRVYTDAS